MGLSSRRFFVTGDGTLSRIANSRYERMLRHPALEPLLQFANQRMRCADLVVELVNRKAQRVCRESFVMLAFDSHGYVDVAQYDHQQGAMMDISLASTIPTKSIASIVVDARQEFAARGGAWMPSPVLRAQLHQAALGMTSTVTV